MVKAEIKADIVKGFTFLDDNFSRQFHIHKEFTHMKQKIDSSNPILLSQDCFGYLGSFSSVGKESTCNAGDPSSIPGSERLAGEGIGYPLQYSWSYLGAQLVKNPPAMRETWV